MVIPWGTAASRVAFCSRWSPTSLAPGTHCKPACRRQTELLIALIMLWPTLNPPAYEAGGQNIKSLEAEPLHGLRWRAPKRLLVVDEMRRRRRPLSSSPCYCLTWFSALRRLQGCLAQQAMEQEFNNLPGMRGRTVFSFISPPRCWWGRTWMGC